MLRFLLLVIVLGFVTWLIMNFLPIGEPFKTIIWFVIIFILIWEVLALVGVTNSYINKSPPSQL